MEIKPTYWIKLFDNISSNYKELLRKLAKVNVSPLQFRVTKRGSKVSLHQPRYNFFWFLLCGSELQRLDLNLNLGRKQVNVIGLHAIIPFCHSKKITCGIRIQMYSKIRIERGSNGEWHFMIFRLTLVSLAHLKKYYQWWLWSMCWIEFVFRFLCFVVVLYCLADQTLFLNLHEFGQRCSWLGFWHICPALNTRMLRILINVCRQGSMVL
jgi:hypothetical protein